MGWWLLRKMPGVSDDSHEWEKNWFNTMFFSVYSQAAATIGQKLQIDEMSIIQVWVILVFLSLLKGFH